MIEITQNSVLSDDIKDAYSKAEVFKLKLNKETIERDVVRLKEERVKSSNTFDKKNLDKLLKYLTKIMDKMDEEGYVEMCWSIGKDGIPVTYPFSFINEPLYKISTANYILLGENDKLIDISIKEVSDIIAFEIMHRDLGEDHDSIEELLDGKSLLKSENSGVLLDKFKETNEDLYRLSKSLRIEDTPYKNIETQKVYDYFGSKEFSSKYYKDVVEYSCKYASAIIANAISKKLKCKYKLIMVGPLDIYFIANEQEKNEIKVGNIESTCIRAFGRKFITNNNITIY